MLPTVSKVKKKQNVYKLFERFWNLMTLKKRFVNHLILLWIVNFVNYKDVESENTINWLNGRRKLITMRFAADIH